MKIIRNKFHNIIKDVLFYCKPIKLTILHDENADEFFILFRTYKINIFKIENIICVLNTYSIISFEDFFTGVYKDTL